MKRIALGSIIVFFLLSTLGCALLYVGSCLFPMEQRPCALQEEALDFTAVHFAVFAKIQGAVAIGAFLLLIVFVAFRKQLKEIVLLALPLRRETDDPSGGWKRAIRFLRWFSLLEKKDSEEPRIRAGRRYQYSFIV